MVCKRQGNKEKVRKHTYNVWQDWAERLEHLLSISSRLLRSPNVLTWWQVSRSPPFPCLYTFFILPFSPPRCPAFTLMGRPRAKQARQTSLPGGCGRGEAPAVFHGSSTVPNDTTDTGERIKRRNTPLQFLVTEFSRLYFYTWWKQDVQHGFEEGCILGKCTEGFFLCLTCLLMMNYVCSCFGWTTLHSDSCSFIFCILGFLEVVRKLL